MGEGRQSAETLGGQAMAVEEKLKHLEFIQAAISRMSQFSFAMKGWSITLISAMFALASQHFNAIYFVVALFPCVMFWSLDGYFLQQERKFRDLFRKVADDEPGVGRFEMNPKEFGDAKATWTSSTFSDTLAVFHGTVLLIVAMVIVWVTTMNASPRGSQ